MKTLFLVLAICAANALADDNLAFFNNVTNLWYQGHKSNVLAIAEDRLACNSNDIAGLILKVEYDLEFTNADSISNGIQRIICVGSDISSPQFRIRYPELKADLEDLMDSIALHPIQNLDAERAKAQIPHKPLLTEADLRLVCLDGLVTNYPSHHP
ncbi:MAG: hypothetical protein ACOX5G_13660 [Kiritimatiellia bacterium]